MAHLVICPICGKKFDRDKEPCVQHGARRYAHVACMENKEQIIKELPEKDKEKIDKQNFHDFINELFQKKCNWSFIQKEEKKYLEQGFSYVGMQKTLYYWYKIKGNSLSSAQGHLGIIPFIYEEAAKYYYELHLIEQRNKDKQKINTSIIEVNIKEPRIQKKEPKLFKLGE